MIRLALLVALCSLCCGCGSLFGVSVQPHKTIARPPANVMVYLSVEQGDQPVASLSRGNFEIYENGVLLDEDETHLRLLPRDSVADGHTVLILDLSGDIDQEDLDKIKRGASHFVEKVSTSQSVTVLVFDGMENVRIVGRFPKVDEPEKRLLPDLTPFVSGDSSRNLNGAVLEAMQILNQELDRSPKPVQLGTVVTMASGPDLAGSKSASDLYQAVDASSYEFYALIASGRKIKIASAIGRDGREEFATMDTLPIAMTELGMRVRNAWGRHYLLSYCSPARGGQRDVRIAVDYYDEHGDQRSGSGKTTFEAEGFESGCGPVRAIVKAREREEAKKREREAQARAEEAAKKARQRAIVEARRRAARRAQSSEDAEATEEAATEEDVVAPPDSEKYE